MYQHNKHQTTKYTGNQNSAVTKKGPFCILYNLYLCLIYQLTKKENNRRERNHHLSKERKPIRLNQSCIEKYQIQAKQNSAELELFFFFFFFLKNHNAFMPNQLKQNSQDHKEKKTINLNQLKTPNNQSKLNIHAKSIRS